LIEVATLPSPQENAQKPPPADEIAAVDLELASAGNRLAVVLDSLMGAMTLGAVGSLVMALGRILR
jgi:hypothetical protein